MSNQKQTQRIALIAAVLGPTALVLLLRVLMGVGPAQASAAGEILPPGQFALRAEQPDAEEAQLLEWLDQQDPLGFHESPMFAEPNEEESPVQVTRRGGIRFDPPDLSGIMGGDRPVAMLAGRARRVGDLVNGVWTVQTIERRYVELSDPDGNLVRIDLD